MPAVDVGDGADELGEPLAPVGAEESAVLPALLEQPAARISRIDPAASRRPARGGRYVVMPHLFPVIARTLLPGDRRTILVERDGRE
jgi:hypothetical protein